MIESAKYIITVLTEGDKQYKDIPSIRYAGDDTLEATLCAIGSDIREMFILTNVRVIKRNHSCNNGTFVLRLWLGTKTLIPSPSNVIDIMVTEINMVEGVVRNDDLCRKVNIVFRDEAGGSLI